MRPRRPRAAFSTAWTWRSMAAPCAASAPCARRATTRLAFTRHGLLPFRQRGARGSLRASASRHRPRVDRRLGRPPRQRNAGAGREASLTFGSCQCISGHGTQVPAPQKIVDLTARSGTCPMPAAQPRERYVGRVDACDRRGRPRLDARDASCVSAGFDSLAGDPLGGFTLEIEDFVAMTTDLVAARGSLVRRPTRELARRRVRARANGCGGGRTPRTSLDRHRRLPAPQFRDVAAYTFLRHVRPSRAYRRFLPYCASSR